MSMNENIWEMVHVYMNLFEVLLVCLTITRHVAIIQKTVQRTSQPLRLLQSSRNEILQRTSKHS